MDRDNAKKIGVISSLGLIIFKSPAKIIPWVVTADALAISSNVSPDDGTITSFPVLLIDFLSNLTKVSTCSIDVW